MSDVLPDTVLSVPLQATQPSGLSRYGSAAQLPWPLTKLTQLQGILESDRLHSSHELFVAPGLSGAP